MYNNFDAPGGAPPSSQRPIWDLQALRKRFSLLVEYPPISLISDLRRKKGGGGRGTNYNSKVQQKNRRSHLAGFVFWSVHSDRKLRNLHNYIEMGATYITMLGAPQFTIDKKNIFGALYLLFFFFFFFFSLSNQKKNFTHIIKAPDLFIVMAIFSFGALSWVERLAESIRKGRKN